MNEQHVYKPGDIVHFTPSGNSLVPEGYYFFKDYSLDGTYALLEDEYLSDFAAYFHEFKPSPDATP